MKIAAYPQAGAITFTTSWGFMAGRAPEGKTALIVLATGFTFENAKTYTVGGFASADAHIFITLEEFRVATVVGESAEQPVGSAGPRLEPERELPVAGAESGARRVRRVLRFRRSIDSPRIAPIHLWSAALGLQVHEHAGEAAPVLLMPVVTGRYYRVWVSAEQSAVCQGVTGPGFGICNFAYDFGPVFFDFV